MRMHASPIRLRAGVGWNWAVQAALHGHDVHVITRANNRASIEGTLREHPMSASPSTTTTFRRRSLAGRGGAATSACWPITISGSSELGGSPADSMSDSGSISAITSRS